ncbi:hypothetical protein QTO34_005645 [Cnephaeus nilssonii]|uniref:Nuclear Testis protein N-terminal domain-containing protein n=1 Tax=Cnephaeus nilssonii TaxID=3371016 RepID=A0AA40HNS4_CNENI|nr:hypothetical protein QTO34_005645 [Eptesicus nilssonii]
MRAPLGANRRNGGWEQLQDRAPPPVGVLLRPGARPPGKRPRLSLQQRKEVEGGGAWEASCRPSSSEPPSASSAAGSGCEPEARCLHDSFHGPALSPALYWPAHSAPWGAAPAAPRTPSFPLAAPWCCRLGPGHLWWQEMLVKAPLGLGLTTSWTRSGQKGETTALPDSDHCPDSGPPLRSAPGAACGGAVCPAPLFLEATACGDSYARLGFWGRPGRQWRLVSRPSSSSSTASCPAGARRPPSGPWNTATRGFQGGWPGRLPVQGLVEDASNPKSVSEDFRRWQRFKALARGHLPQSPDAAALCCFLMPALRPLSRLKPTMTLEEGIGRAMQEWQRKSTCDRRVYFEMAEKFMAFEAEEQMQVQKLQLKKGAQTQPPPAPPRPDPRGPPAPVVGRQPGKPASFQGSPWPKATGPSASHCPPHIGLLLRGLCTHPQEGCTQRPVPPHTPAALGDRVSGWDPPAAEQEDMDITDELPMGAPGGGWEDEVKEWLQDEGLLSYLDQLCSQEDFVTQVEEVIDPQFLKQMNSPDAQQDPLALAEELEQEEGLTAAQLAEERLLASEEGGVQAPPSHGAPRWDSSPSESASSPDARRREPGPQLGVSDTACPPETGFQDRQRRGPAHAPRSRPPAAAVSSGREEHPPLRARCPPAAPRATGLLTVHGDPGRLRPRRGLSGQGAARASGQAPWGRGGPRQPGLPLGLSRPPAALRALSESCPCLGPGPHWRSGAPGRCPIRSLQRQASAALPLQLASLGSASGGRPRPCGEDPPPMGRARGLGEASTGSGAGSLLTASQEKV